MFRYLEINGGQLIEWRWSISQYGRGKAWQHFNHRNKVTIQFQRWKCRCSQSAIKYFKNVKTDSPSRSRMTQLDFVFVGLKQGRSKDARRSIRLTVLFTRKVLV
jgi:hypothetical protein